MPIKDTYQGIIRQIMREQKPPVPVMHSPPPRDIFPNDGVAPILQHTDWYLHQGDIYSAKQFGHPYRPHYRYRRYLEALNEINRFGQPFGGRIVHVDIGCGAGLFSWVFLDWAISSQIEYGRIDLYGLDHCQEMINLAYLMRTKFIGRIGDYPMLHYFSDLNDFIPHLTHSQNENADYVITFGHALVQAFQSDRKNILTFAQIIENIIWVMKAQFSCKLIAVDARRESSTFTVAWELLLNTLRQAEIGHQLYDMRATAINNSNDVRLASLYLI